MNFDYDVVVIGGFGHVGLPLSIAFADQGLRVCAYDISDEKYKSISSGKMPFIEYGAEEILKKVLNNGQLQLSLSPEVISKAEIIIIVVGTPVDRHLNPEFDAFRNIIEPYIKYFKDNQLLVLRSTVYPGTTQRLAQILFEYGKNLDVAFCPERIAEGYAMKELYELPQIVSSYTESGVKRASDLFRHLTNTIVVIDPLEAELAKLFTNAWRYIKFSVANQFFMIANECKADYYKIYHAMTYEYPRAQDLPRPGFAAGPCLFKDTVQLSAFNNHTFYLGHSAILINEGLPYYIVNKLKQKYPLKDMTVGILGMAFKANIDDKRDSLSYKMKKLLEFECKKVYCSDVYIKEEGFVKIEELINNSDIIILGVPHREYLDVKIDDNKLLIDIWNFYGKGCII